MDFDLKRASLLSNVYAEEKKKNSKLGTKSGLEVPEDKYYLCFMFSLFSGVVGLIPLTFFLTANDYWMYKLRDTSLGETYDLNNKTFLQKMFASLNMIVNAVPSVASIILTIFFGHRIEMRTKFLLTLGISSFMFIVFTILVKVNTDSWQTLFFSIALIVLGIIALASPLYNMSSVSYLSRFPPFYLKLNMVGSAGGGLFGSVLQVISLSISDNSTDVALIYFTSGTVLICFTFLLAYLTKYSPMINFYANSVEQHKKPAHTFKEYVEVFKRIWPIPLMIFLANLSSVMGHPTITSLIVSEGYVQNGDNLWYDKYFVVVATYFLFDFIGLVGRFFSRPVITKKNYPIFIAIVAARSFLASPLYLFCNAQPRNHLPVWFPHDYQYMIVHATMSFSASVLTTSQIVSVTNFAEEKTELAFTLTIGFLMCSMTVLSPLSSIFVNIL